MVVQDWIGRALVPVAVSVAFVLFQHYFPVSAPNKWSYETRQTQEPLPTGAIGATMWGIGLCLVGSFFAFREANHLWALLDGPAVLKVYETPVIWCFFPGFAALSIPWPLTIWMLRKNGRRDEADEIAGESSGKSGFDSYRVMTWLSYGIALPIGVFTLLAIPIHLSIGDTEVKVGHYARWTSEAFHYDQAVRARQVTGMTTRNGKTITTRNLLIDFSDGRTLDASVGQDGGDPASPEVVTLLLEKTKLVPVVQ